jgi:hypothetical protein
LPTRAFGNRGKLKPPPKIIVPPEEMGEVVPREPISPAFVLVRNPDESMIWNSVTYHYHYIGGYRLFGPQLRYLVYCQNGSSSAEQYPAGRLVAALSFSAAAWRVACRDDHIGWTDAQRTANLPLVLNNSRFLILPWVQVPIRIGTNSSVSSRIFASSSVPQGILSSAVNRIVQKPRSSMVS